MRNYIDKDELLKEIKYLKPTKVQFLGAGSLKSAYQASRDLYDDIIDVIVDMEPIDNIGIVRIKK